VQGKIFERLFKLAEIKKLTHTEMEQYQKSISDYADVRDCMDCARKEGREEGMEKGREEGIEKGGIAKSFEIAKNLLDLHLPVKDIAKATGLTPEQIFTL
jgi:predicted transposase/invertase (TIGR01784 family)